jgi:3-hydroxyanthranilate 3,4-dioxygenase
MPTAYLRRGGRWLCDSRVVFSNGMLALPPSGSSPRFPPDAYVIERPRRPVELARVQWFHRACDTFLHEESVHVADYRTDPVGKAYQRFFDDLTARTCSACGDVMPVG